MPYHYTKLIQDNNTEGIKYTVVFKINKKISSNSICTKKLTINKPGNGVKLCGRQCLFGTEQLQEKDTRLTFSCFIYHHLQFLKIFCCLR